MVLDALLQLMSINIKKLLLINNKLNVLLAIEMNFIATIMQIMTSYENKY